jgi:8-oxo-dGTP pyrophosphatase MutT (NUDIX family)
MFSKKWVFRGKLMMDCATKDKWQRVVEILEKIPRSDEDTMPLYELCPFVKKDNPSCTNCVLGILALLRVFNVVLITDGSSDEESRVKARSEAALYFLRSLAQFIRKDLVLTGDWEREGVLQEVSPIQLISSGTQLVHTMEKIRTEELSDLTPIRKVFVSQAVIKARIRGKRQSLYLVQYDAPAHQYQLIGGRRRKSERNPLTVMKREISEELAENSLVYPRDYNLLKLVSDLKINSLSPTFGAFTSYNFTVYHAVFKCPKLFLGPNDRWVSLSELIAGETIDGARISSTALRKVDALVQNGLEGLKLSLEDIQH